MSRPEYVDSHAHLDLCKDDAAGIVEAAAAEGVSRIVTVGTDLKSSRQAAAHAGNFPGVLATAGIHPHGAARADDADLDELAALAATADIVAIGETGLDFFRDLSPRDAQRRLFLSHIELARRAGLPLMVHSRDAAGETMEVLERHAGDLTVIIHCFSLTDHVDACRERGYYISVAGNITYRNAGALRDAVGKMPPERLLTETDSPYLSPEPRRGQPNQPANIPLVLEAIAEAAGLNEGEMAATVRENFAAIFERRPPVM